MVVVVVRIVVAAVVVFTAGFTTLPLPNHDSSVSSVSVLTALLPPPNIGLEVEVVVVLQAGRLSLPLFPPPPYGGLPPPTEASN